MATIRLLQTVSRERPVPLLAAFLAATTALVALGSAVPGAAQTWTVDADGNWSTATNWSPQQMPNSVGAIATLGSAITAARTVRLDRSISVGTLSLAGDHGYTVATTDYFTRLTFDVAAGSASLTSTATVPQTIQSGINLNDPLAVNLQSSTVSILGDTFGTGSLTLSGPGTLVLGGTASATVVNHGYTGATTIGPGSTLQVGSGPDVIVTNFMTSAIRNDGVLRVDARYGMSYAGNITGTGAVIVESQRGLESGANLSGTNTYTGGTVVRSGMFTVGSGTSGSIEGSVMVESGAGLQFGRSDTAIFSNKISGAGDVYRRTAGTTILTGDNDYTGKTFVNPTGNTVGGDQVLQVGAGGTSGSIGSGDVSMGRINFGGSGVAGYLRYNRSDDIVVSNNFTVVAGDLAQIGPGKLTLVGNIVLARFGTIAQDGGGTLTLAGNISDDENYTSGARIEARTGDIAILGNVDIPYMRTRSGGTIQVGNGGTTGTVVVRTVTNDGVFIYNRSDTSTLRAFDIVGNGQVRFEGSATTILLGSLWHTGGTFIKSGATVQLGNGVNGGYIREGNIENHGILSVQPGAPFSGPQPFAGVISGTGDLRVEDGVYATLTGNNTYTGRTIIARNASIQVGNDGTTGRLGSGAVVLDGSLFLRRTDTVTIGADISGTGNLYLDGRGGTLVLTGNNSGFSGFTAVNYGTLRVGDGGTSGTLGTGRTFVADNASVVFDRSDSFRQEGRLDFFRDGSVFKDGAGTLTLAGDITGSVLGNVVRVRAGTLVLEGANGPFGVPMAIDPGATLELGSGGTTGSTAGVVTNDGRLVFNRSNTYQHGGVISGRGAMVQRGAGTTILTGTNTYSGGTTVEAGTLQLGNGGTTGSIVGNVAIAGGATLAFNRSNSLVLDGVVSGEGAVRQAGTGTTILAADNSYSGGTLIAAGTLQVGNGGTTGTLGSGPVVDDGVLAISRSGSFEVPGAITGTGRLDQRGPGTTVLTGANTYSGGTTITAGTLQLGNGGTSGSILGNVANNGTLVFNRSDAVTFGGTISGTGGVIQRGTGSTDLTAASIYTGPTQVEAGTLRVNGSIASDTTVFAAGTLGGTGTITGAVVNNGTIAPGNSIGQLNIVGSYTQAAGSFYQVEINPAGSADRIMVSGAPGTATIQGGTITVLAANGIYPLTYRYTVVTATGGVTGTYAGVTSNLAFVTPRITYDANNVYLEVSAINPTDPTNPAVPTVQFRRGATTFNQAAVACALDQVAAGASGDFANAVGALMGLDTTQGPAALDALSGVPYGGFATANLFTGGLFAKQLREEMAISRGAGSDRWIAHRDKPGEISGLHAWGAAFGGTGTVAGGPSAAGTTACGGAAPGQAFGQSYSAAGFAAGIDYRVHPAVLVGVGVGYAGATEWTNGLNSRGTSDSVMVGAYTSFTYGGAYADLLAGFAHNTNRMTRQMTLPGLGMRTAYGATGAPQWFGQAELGYRFDLGTASTSMLAPFARLEAATVAQNGFTEWGADALNLAVAGQATSSLRTVLGAELTAAYRVGWQAPLALQVRVGWAHDYADMARPVTAAFAAAPGASFTVLGATPPRDSATIGIGLSTVFGDHYRLFLRYEGDVAGASSSHAINAGLRFGW